MITVYVDPNDGNQVMAFFDNCKPGDASVWIGRGFVSIEVPGDHPRHAELIQLQRDCQYSDIAMIERTNPIQPIPTPDTYIPSN